MIQIDNHGTGEQWPAELEEKWIKNLLLLAEIQRWTDESSKNLINMAVGPEKSFVWKHLHLTAACFSEILVNHYYKIQKEQDTARFCIPVHDIILYMQAAAEDPAEPVPDRPFFQTLANAGEFIGYDRNNFPTCFFTILSDASGRILTAFPGFPAK